MLFFRPCIKQYRYIDKGTIDKLIDIRTALITLQITTDSLFNSIKESLDRGLIDEARRQLSFVDLIVK